MWNNKEGKLSWMLRGVRSRSKAKRIPFDIDIDYLNDLWNANDGCCALTRIPFQLGPGERKGRMHKYGPSLDRIIPKLGYIKGNVRLITNHMNVALSDYGLEAFEELVRAYKEYA